MFSAAIVAIGLVTPGMATWRDGRAVLCGDGAFQPQPLPKHTVELLPANERRRATPLIRLALCAVEDCLGATTGHAQLASVFASSGGDTGNLHALCEQLAKDAKAISPTAFHNSVHNAVAGYWSIAGQARAPSISISAHDATFVAGLLEAFALVAERAAPVLYAAYDTEVGLPMYNKRPVAPDFAVAMLLAPWLGTAPGDAFAGVLRVDRADLGTDETALVQTGLESLRLGNPAARSLPLLRLVAAHAPGTLVLADGEERWRLHFQPSGLAMA